MKMRPTRPAIIGFFAIAGAAAAISGGLLSAQTPAASQAKLVMPRTAQEAKANTDWGHLNFESHVGSFKMLGSDEVPVTGALDMSFTGTVLVSVPAKGTQIQTSGNVHLEYQTKDKQKLVYFGTGRISVVGQVRAIQFFGRELKGHFDGVTIMRFYGEFDKSLNTGTYWFDGPGTPEKYPWGTSGNNIPIPSPGVASNRPKVRVNTTGG